jgi:hypothetical protein
VSDALMATASCRSADVSLASLSGLEPIEQVRRRWPALLSGVLGALLIGGLIYQLFGDGLRGLEVALPRNPLFYLIFALSYFVLPLCDYLIFRRLWRLPLAGLVPLLKKRIANEVVLGYSGEAYFYAWARARLKIVAAPFAAIKDVSIISAIAGNLVTLLMLALAAPVAVELIPAHLATPVLWSVAIIVSLSLLMLFLRTKLFSLPKADLGWIGLMHLGRLAVATISVALCWHLALPEVALGFWLILATAKLTVSRLPLIANKDLLFANLAVLMVGQDGELARLMALMAALTLLIHIALTAAFTVGSFFERRA